MTLKAKIQKTHPKAKIPTYGTSGSACFDIYSIEAGKVSETNPRKFRTGLKMEIPENHVLMIFSRSGHGFNNNIRLSNCVGIIDSDFRGEISVKLAQDSAEIETQYQVEVGDRIAQGMIIQLDQVEFEWVDKLSDTERGENGFHSTGR
jgi:dUTP pyrophosphatase